MISHFIGFKIIEYFVLGPIVVIGLLVLVVGQAVSTISQALKVAGGLALLSGQWIAWLFTACRRPRPRYGLAMHRVRTGRRYDGRRDAQSSDVKDVVRWHLSSAAGELSAATTRVVSSVREIRAHDGMLGVRIKLDDEEELKRRARRLPVVVSESLSAPLAAATDEYLAVGRGVYRQGRAEQRVRSEFDRQSSGVRLAADRALPIVEEATRARGFLGLDIGGTDAGQRLDHMSARIEQEMTEVITRLRATEPE